MGIPRTINPDYCLVQLLLKIDYLQRILLGINREPQFARKTRQDIESIGRLAFEVGKQTSITLQCSVNTKLHRIMRHSPDHFLDYGCFRWK